MQNPDVGTLFQNRWTREGIDRMERKTERKKVTKTNLFCLSVLLKSSEASHPHHIFLAEGDLRDAGSAARLRTGVAVSGHVAVGQHQWYHFGVGEFTVHFSLL